ncbi:LppX_LprAFG lipoprotein [Amycolatopsis balhimycina DSM 5908]|uniref:LppX_LprAFG lipoprotein n=1 Tax=Amycolatopsis balhimycina DSM 5908 TaxID=1081091 RepID=A0A428WVE3_AMYBA|nr:LppX_LprAFG lipoprotein [Amycolatopsis balhimycina]RSM47032.1 LppX_LprAFG lipoprotein [Amycolatopsis balhimycina DSM 5908]
MILRRTLLAAMALGAAIVTGCSSGGDASLPDAGALLKDSATAAGGITSTHFTLKVNGTVPGLSVHSLDGDLTKANGGGAKGTGTLELMGQVVDAQFVLVNGSLYIKGPTGGFQRIPAVLSSSIYDPSAILDPQRGIPKVLSSVQGPKTAGKEDVDGTPTYRVTGTVPKDALAALVPGVSSDANATFWLRQDGGHLPVKASLGYQGGASVDVTLSDVDKPVTVTAPA